MFLIPLNNNYNFSIEPITNRRMQLMVYKNCEVYVCRKENIKQLKEFLNADEAQAFNGRLQLFKHQNDIAIEVNGEHIGTIGKSTMEGCLAGL